MATSSGVGKRGVNPPLPRNCEREKSSTAVATGIVPGKVAWFAGRASQETGQMPFWADLASMGGPGSVEYFRTEAQLLSRLRCFTDGAVPSFHKPL